MKKNTTSYIIAAAIIVAVLLFFGFHTTISKLAARVNIDTLLGQAFQSKPSNMK